MSRFVRTDARTHALWLRRLRTSPLIARRISDSVAFIFLSSRLNFCSSIDRNVPSEFIAPSTTCDPSASTSTNPPYLLGTRGS